MSPRRVLRVGGGVDVVIETNGPTEATNLVIERNRRIAHGYRNFTNYRL